MRKITLLSCCIRPKSGCGKLQPDASLRPAILNSACTPPSAVGLKLPSAFTANGKRTSRTGPSLLRKDGIEFLAPSIVAMAICGLDPKCGYAFAAGLLPPTAGCAWQLPQLLALNVGPNPIPGSPG